MALYESKKMTKLVISQTNSIKINLGGKTMKKSISKLIAMFFIMGLAVVGITACGNSNEGVTQKEETNEENKTDVETGSEEESKGEGSKEVVVYSPAPEDMLTEVIQEFQETTGIKVELVQAGSGELLARIESESQNPLADVMFGAGAEALEANKDSFTEYISPEAENVRPEYKSAEGKWTGVYVSPTVIMYNKNLVPENEVPTGWQDFADPKWKGKLAFADPVASGSSYTTLTILLSAMDKGDEGWDYIRDYVDALDGNILNSSSAPHKGVADGEYSMCITQEQAVLQYTNAGADHIGIVYPEEGTGAIPSVVSIVKGAPNEENAKLFVDFLLSADMQKKMPEFLHHLVRTDLDYEGDFMPINDIKLANFDFMKAAESKDENIEKWNDIVIGR